MASARTGRSAISLPFAPGHALMPDDFSDRLARLRERFGLTWEGMASCMGVDSRQLLRWRRGGHPNAGAMLALVRLATKAPDGLADLIGEDIVVMRRPGR